MDMSYYFLLDVVFDAISVVVNNFLLQLRLRQKSFIPAFMIGFLVVSANASEVFFEVSGWVKKENDKELKVINEEVKEPKTFSKAS